LKQGKVEEALPLLLQLHQSEPQDARVCLQLGVVYTQLQQLAKAADFYRAALRIDSTLLPAQRNLGTVLWFLNQKEESVRQFSGLLRTQPNDSVAHFYLGTFEYERNEFAKAKGHFDKAGDLASNNPEALPMVLETYLATKDTSGSDRMVSQLEVADTPNGELILQAGILLLRYDHYDQAVRAFEKLAALGSAKPETYILLAEAYDKQAKPEKAYTSLSKAIQLEPKSEDGYLALASFASAHQNNEFALKTVGQGLEMIPKSPKLLLQQGIIWALDGDLIQAEESFRQASLSDPRWNLPRLALGVSQLQASKPAQAATTFQQVAKEDPADYRPQYLYALSLIRSGAQEEVARRGEIIVALQRAVQLNPKDAESRVLLGQTYMSAGQPEPAIRELLKATELDPKNPTAHYQLGIAYRKQGKAALAQLQFRTFEELKVKLKNEETEERRALIQMLKVAKDK
jgi:tetratricopeptide (TPR) repeat protein